MTFDEQRLQSALRELLDALPATLSDLSNLSQPARRRLRDNVGSVIVALQEVLPALDPISLPPHVLDPSDPDVVGRLIAETLLVQERHPLGTLASFYGSGVYAIYYTGAFDAYKPISVSNTPIYVGKADPTSPVATTPVQQGTKLWGRLNDHRRSIHSTSNLEINDFECRYLVVKSAWQGTAETYLISRFSPIWNNEVGVCYGFGKHGDSSSTRANTRSPWDTLHPGRAWATSAGNKPYPLTPEQIEERIAQHFRVHSPQV